MKNQTKAEAPIFGRFFVSGREEPCRALASAELDLRPAEIHSIVAKHSSELTELLTLFQHNESEEAARAVFKETMGVPPRPNQQAIYTLTATDALFSGLSVFENIYLFERELYSFPRRRLRARCETLLASYGLHFSPSSMPASLSPEECRLVQLLRLLVHKPQLIVIQDSWNIFHDSVYAITFQNLIGAIKANNGCVVYLTTQFESAVLFSDRLSIIKNGRITDTFPGADVLRNPREFMYILSGWEYLKEGAGGNEELELLEMLANAKNIVSFNAELKEALLFLCADIVKIMKSAGCLIVLIDENRQIMDSTSYWADEGRKVTLAGDFIANFIKHNKTLTPFSIDTAEQAGLLSDETHSIRSIVCMPIQIYSETAALIVVAYDTPYGPITNKAQILLSTFAKEVAISIETSRLIGRSSLVQESHHRIKNNLQIIINLVYMEKARLLKCNQLDLIPVLDSVISRVKTIAIVHDLLSYKPSGNSAINLKKILQSISNAYTANDTLLNVSVENISIPYNKAISIALVTNELIANCVKHAKLPGRQLCIAINCNNNGEDICLCIRDNGNGFPDGFDRKRDANIGLDIIISIIESLSGRIVFSNDAGAKVEICIPREKVYMP